MNTRSLSLSGVTYLIIKLVSHGIPNCSSVAA
jgi:hypothetical protein